MQQLITYFWHGITHLGIKKHGIIYARSKKDVKIQLREINIITRSIRKRHQHSLMSITQKIWFCRQVATLINAHISLHSALDLLQSSSKSRELKFLIATLIHDLDHGRTWAEALHKHPRVFDSFFCGLVKISEASGTLNKSLDLIAAHYENTYNLYQNIKKTLTYPIIVVSLGCMISISLCIIIVPQFEELFNDTKISLPLFTKCVICFSHGLRNYGMYVLLIFIMSSTGLYITYQHNQLFKSKIANLINHIPIIGNLYHKTIITKFTHTLSIACSAGISLIDALELIRDLTTNYQFNHAIGRIINDIRSGHEVSNAFSKTEFFPKMMTQMIKIGSTSGKLNQVLQHMAQYYTHDTQQTIASIMRLLEPTITILLGIFVGGLVIAMYVPLLQLGTIISV